MSNFRNCVILPRFWVPEIDNFARKLSLRYVEMMKITKHVLFRKIILFVGHPTLGCPICVKLEKSKFLKFFLIFLKFWHLVWRAAVFLFDIALVVKLISCCKFDFITFKLLTCISVMILSWLIFQNLRHLP